MQATEFTRFILPDGNGRTVNGQLGLTVGQTIHKGDIAEFPELNGWKVSNTSKGHGGKTNHRGEWTGGTCLFIHLR